MADGPSQKKRKTAKGQEVLLAKFLEHIVGVDEATDAEGETYLDLRSVGFITDKNVIESITSRQSLWEKHPELEGRLVLFPFYNELFKLTEQAVQSGKSVIVTGTPGVGKSALRTAHTHSFLRKARNAGQSCRIILGKGGNNRCRILTMLSDGSTSVQTATDVSAVLDEHRSIRDPQVQEDGQNEEEDFVLGRNCFVLVDVSNGNFEHYADTSAGLVIYSSPNKNLIDHQIFKANATRLAYPLIDKDVTLRYKDDGMEELYEKYGGLPRLVWGSKDDESLHLSRLDDSLQDVEGFLSTAATENYLVGPHRFYYTDVRKDEFGDWIHDIAATRPGVAPAPKHVMRIAAKKVVNHLLSPSVKATFGLEHKTVSGVLFEEVCFHLLEQYRENIKIEVKSLNNKRTLTTAKLAKGGELELDDTPIDRKDVKASNLVEQMSSQSAGDLIVPTTSNFPGLDGVLVLQSGDKLDFWLYLQMTVSLIHPVADAGVDTLDELSGLAPRKKNQQPRQAMAFLVPANNFDSFKRQDAKSTGKQKAFEKFPQYVMRIEIL